MIERDYLMKLTQNDLNKLTKPRANTPNILMVNSAPINEGAKSFEPAPKKIRAYAQNIIDTYDEHRHLRKAKIFIIIKFADADVAKMKKAETVIIGQASKATPHEKMLSRIIGKDCKCDFVVKLSGDWLKIIEKNEPDLLGYKTCALIDHELLHCGAKIAGEFVDPDAKQTKIDELGELHLQTLDDFTNDKGQILIKSYHTDKDGQYVFTMRKHDVEEFTAIAGRYGAWKNLLSQFIDVLIESNNEPNLFDTKKSEVA